MLGKVCKLCQIEKEEDCFKSPKTRYCFDCIPLIEEIRRQKNREAARRVKKETIDRSKDDPEKIAQRAYHWKRTIKNRNFLEKLTDISVQNLTTLFFDSKEFKRAVKNYHQSEEFRKDPVPFRQTEDFRKFAEDYIMDWIDSLQ